MIPLILGILIAVIQTSFFGALAPANWHIMISVATVVYLYRFGLRHLGHPTSWVIGLGLDLMSSWTFGVWLVIILMVDLIADLALPSRTANTAESIGLALVGGLSALATLSINLYNHQAWFISSLGSALIVTVIYYLAVRATMVWRIYE